MKALESPLVSSLVGGVAFLATWLFTLLSAAPSIRPAAPVHTVVAPDGTVISAPTHPVESWIYYNPEVDLLLKELKSERKALTDRERELQSLAQRLKAERTELDQVAASVKKMQAEIDQQLTEIKAEEVPNLKRLAKTYSTMTPAGAAELLGKLDDVPVVKTLALMKEAEVGPILEAMTRMGPAEATRAAALTEKIRLAKQPAATKGKP